MRIIIVEDEQRARRGLKSLLQMVSDDCEVVADASDGKKALELIRKCKPEVVFTDIKMPYMDGLELIREVRKEDTKTKFVIVSAYEEFDYARQAISLGVTDYLIKPIIMDDVEKVITNITRKDEVTKNEEKNENCHPLIRKSLKIIEKEYASQLSQKELAARLGITAEYFCNLFAKEMDESFVKYLKKYRIDVAKTLLTESNESRDDIAYKVGYTDTKYFAKVFRDVTGKTITEYIAENM